VKKNNENRPAPAPEPRETVKKPYQTPELSAHGTVAEITKVLLLSSRP